MCSSKQPSNNLVALCLHPCWGVDNGTRCGWPLSVVVLWHCCGRLRWNLLTWLGGGFQCMFFWCWLLHFPFLINNLVFHYSKLKPRTVFPMYIRFATAAGDLIHHWPASSSVAHFRWIYSAADTALNTSYSKSYTALEFTKPSPCNTAGEWLVLCPNPSMVIIQPLHGNPLYWRDIFQLLKIIITVWNWS